MDLKDEKVRAARAAVSTEAYVEVGPKLRDKDALGFAAAGIFPYIHRGSKSCVLMIEEKRGDRTLLNFIGGKRESSDGNHAATANREFEEKTNSDLFQLLSERIDYTAWLPKAKYAMIFRAFIYHNHNKYTNVLPQGAVFVQFKQLREKAWRKNHLHPFAADMVVDLLKLAEMIPSRPNKQRSLLNFCTPLTDETNTFHAPPADEDMKAVEKSDTPTEDVKKWDDNGYILSGFTLVISSMLWAILRS